MKTSTDMKMKFGSENLFAQKIQLPDQQASRVCPSCGAPALSEVCQYCGTYVGTVATSELTPEYELVHCKNARLTLWNLCFPAVFGVTFTFGGVGSMISALLIPSKAAEFRLIPLMSSFVFLLIGLAALVILFINVKHFLDTKLHGVVREGIVYGYMDDVVSYNNNNGQQVKILLDTAEGKKFIMLPLGTPVKLYEINSPIRVRLYKTFAMITTDAADKINW
ncbi:MAG: hypothetical protein J6N53_01040 [Lachnospiraceae bacterium]|nr:hypothetical protein [Lachnospiraceae bacterium]